MAKRPSNKSRPKSGQKPGRTAGQAAGQQAADPKAAGSVTVAKKPAGGTRAAAASQATKPTGKAGRVSVAQGRPVKPGSNRTQLIIGGVAVALIVAVVVIGLVINKQQNTVPEEGYGASKSSTATVSDGVITFSNGSPSATIEVFEDGLCPICGEFEGQYSDQIAKSVDEGKLAVKLHMLTFLNPQSASGDYSTRAAAAMLAVANEAGDEPGVALAFHSKLFANQPQEGGSSDLDNKQLAALAADVGAPEAAQQAITDGKYLDQAVAGDTSSQKYLGDLLGSVQTPTVLHDKSYVDTREVDWLTNIVG